jgi:DNA polymerase I-like protein with 3'-5' exonuclease and polymerase domains
MNLLSAVELEDAPTWFPPAVFPVLPRTGELCVDVETKDVDLSELGPGVRRPGNYVVGLAVGTDDGRRWYFPMRHEGGGNLDERIVWAWAREELNAFRGTIVGAKLSYDLDWLAENGVTFPLVECFDDVQIAEPLIDEQRYEFNLDALSKDYLGERKVSALLATAANARGWKTEKQIKSNLWRLPASMVGAYAEGDVDLPLRIIKLQREKIEAEHLGQIWEVERRLVRPLVDMTRRGVRVDVPGAERTLRDMTAVRDRLLAEVRRLSSPKAELAIPASFVDALRANGHDIPKTAKTGADSIKKEWLAARLNDPLCAAIFNGRKVQTLISTFLEGNILGSNINGRIHCEWLQLKDDDGGTIARTASRNPNLANIPGRDDDRADEDLREVAAMIRGLFLPEPNEDWGSADYSQI